MKKLSDLVGEVIVECEVNSYGNLIVATESGLNLVVEGSTARVVDIEDIEASENNYWVSKGSIPVFQHKEVIFANNANLSDIDQEDYLKAMYPGVEWEQVEYQIYDVELQFWLPKHLLGELDRKLRNTLVEVHQFVTNERDIEIVIEDVYDFICEDANYICIMLDNIVAHRMYSN